MNKKLKISTSININASAEKVWQTLMDTEKFPKYFFGVKLESNWKVGEPIYFKGEMEGEKFEDKGVLRRIDPPEFLEYTYWSGWSGLENIPENYSLVKYKLSDKGDHTILQIVQEGFASVDAQKHSDAAWAAVLDNLKNLIEESSD